MKGFIKVRFRRAREHRTDYAARLGLLRSGLPRLVVRKTNRYIIAQLVKSQEAQDYVVCTAHSKELLEYGWPASFSIKNLASAYLTGFLAGTKAKKKGINQVILDIGLARSTKGSRIYAVLKGAVDAGLKIPYSEEMLPKEEQLKKAEIAKIKEKISK